MNQAPNVFLSWSGERSRKIAEIFSEWLSCVVQAARPFISTKDIYKGSFWFQDIADWLNTLSVGIFFITQENKNRPWILFEAGALNKGLRSNMVCTLLIDLVPEDIKGPLEGFNHTELRNKESLFELIKTINSQMDVPIPEKVLLDVFETYYDKFKARYHEILKNTKPLGVYKESLEEQMAALNKMMNYSAKQLNQAILAYSNMQSQGVINVYKCDSKEYSSDGATSIKKRLQDATKIRCMFHIGQSFLADYWDELNIALNNPKCTLQLLVITDDLVGPDVDILRRLCPKSKKDENANLTETKSQILRLADTCKVSTNIELRQYDFAPTGSILIIDNFVRFVPYLPNRQSETSIAIFGEKREDASIFDEFEIVFNDIWKECGEAQGDI